jgi:hypothetical protein
MWDQSLYLIGYEKRGENPEQELIIISQVLEPQALADQIK